MLDEHVEFAEDGEHHLELLNESADIEIRILKCAL